MPIDRDEVRRHDRRPEAGIGAHRHNPPGLAKDLRRDGEDGDNEIVEDESDEQGERYDHRTLRPRLKYGDQSGEGDAEDALQRDPRREEEMERAKADRVAGDDTEPTLQDEPAGAGEEAGDDRKRDISYQAAKPEIAEDEQDRTRRKGRDCRRDDDGDGDVVRRRNAGHGGRYRRRRPGDRHDRYLLGDRDHPHDRTGQRGDRRHHHGREKRHAESDRDEFPHFAKEEEIAEAE